MLQKCMILGLVLLLAGGLTFAWVHSETRADDARDPNAPRAFGAAPYLEKYGQWHQLTPEQQEQILHEIDDDSKNKTQEQLAQEQQARLEADLDRLAAGDLDPGDLADFFYGKGWETQVELYKHHREQVEIAQTISIVLLAIGGTVFGLSLLGWLLRSLARVVAGRRQRYRPPADEPEPTPPELMDIEPHNDPEEPEEPPEAESPPQADQERPRSRRKVLTLSEMATSGDAVGASSEDDAGLPAFPAGASNHYGASTQAFESACRETSDGAVAVLMTDEESLGGEWSPEAQWASQCTLDLPAARSQKPATPRGPAPAPAPSAPPAEDHLQEQAEGLQKQIAEFKQMAETMQQAQASREQSEPLGSTLKELAQQVSAIREYAACQQNRVEKLQDGYDWGIIRTFCLRVIRCIDNLENRIENLNDDEESREHLEEVHDELIFALESSNVEQYRPDVNSEFRGQEKLAETMKQREPAPEPDLAGKIAKVIRPGYRYIVDDENYKVVRTAQVKLFG